MTQDTIRRVTDDPAESLGFFVWRPLLADGAEFDSLQSVRGVLGVFAG